MIVPIDEMYHYGVKGQSWYEHQYGKYQNHAKYASGHTEQKERSNNERSDDERSKKLSALPLKDSSKKYSIQDDAKAVNPNFDDGEEYQNNCAYCSIAYELRRRGYDVEANPRSKLSPLAEKVPFLHLVDTYANALMKAFPPGDTKSVTWYHMPDEVRNVTEDKLATMSRDCLRDLASTYPNGRGFLTVKWYGTELCHSLTWETKKGRVTIVDAQSGEIWTNRENCINDMLCFVSDLEFRRIDNIDFDEDYVKKAVH